MNEEPGYLGARFKGKYETAGQVVLCVLQLLGSHRFFDDAPVLIQQSVNREFHVLRRRSDERNEPAGVHPGSHGNACKGRVGETQFITKPLRDPGRESCTATKNGVEHLQGVKVGIGASDSKMTQINVELLSRHRQKLNAFGGLPFRRGIRWE